MSRNKRERSPAAEYEVDLHSPARRKSRLIRPAHTHYNSRCRLRFSPTSSPDSSDSEESLTTEGSPSLEADGLHVVFADAHSPRTSPPPDAPAPSSTSPPSSPVASAPSSPTTSPPPRPEPIADKLRRIARDGKAKARAAQGGEPNSPGPSREEIYARSEARIRSDPVLRALVEEGRVGVYVDSANPNFIRIVDAAPDTGAP
ncbi:hypothetical protein EXIGLDRAFT_765070 [Exidia glandulosa HHB12029]|uniref:Uncharacterized protein n=1 Tax=Exidia glandulosa HHB12029 TaxID=1314781 RepID=A0A165KQ80_EXIGL|nr:hypothetical protein EXIGLDRAFT_765070 [Exidia glandulosa HHB12029]